VARRNSRTNARSWRAQFRLIGGLLIFCMLVIFRGIIISPLVSVDTVEIEERSFEITAKGYSIYREQPLFAPLSGEIQFVVDDGQLVPKNSVVAVFESSISETYNRRLQQLKRQLDSWKSNNERALILSRQALAEYEDDIMKAIISAKSGDGIEKLHTTTESFHDEFNKFKMRWSELIKLQEDIQTLEKLKDDATEKIVAPSPGVIRTEMDGLGTLLDWDNELSEDSIKSLIDSTKTESIEVFDGKHVQAGYPVARILDHLELEGLLIVDDSWSEEFEEGEMLSLKIPDNDVGVKAQISQPVFGLEGKKVMRVSISDPKPFFYANRRWEGSVEICMCGVSEIPKSALSYKDGISGVTLWNEGNTKWKHVEVIEESGNKALIKGIDSGCEIITNPAILRWFWLN